MIERLRNALGGMGYELGSQELFDVLWLARIVGSGAAGSDADPPTPSPLPEKESVFGLDRPTNDASPTPGVSVNEGAIHPAQGLGNSHRFFSEAGGQQPTGGPRARAVRSPRPRALPELHRLARALRPLHGYRDHRHRTEADIEPTVRFTADSGLLDIVEAPARELRHTAVLLVDDSPSMGMWGAVVGDVRRLLERSGVFRAVRVHRFGLRGGSLPVTVPRAESPVVLLLTDAVDTRWRSASAGSFLTAWARTGPFAILHLLPKRLWRGTAFPAQPHLITAERPFPMASELTLFEPLSESRVERPSGTVPVPVVPLSPVALSSWAKLLTQPGRRHMADAVLYATNEHVAPSFSDETAPADRRPADVLLKQFRASFSPEAYRLAVRLSAVRPLSTPIIQLVRTATLPEASSSVVAEVLLGGLLEPLDAHEAAGHRGAVAGVGDVTQYDFRPGVRDLLVSGLSTEESIGVVEAVGRAIETRLGRMPDFAALLAHRDGSYELSPEAAAFAVLVSPVLDRLYGVPSRGLIGEPTHWQRWALPTTESAVLTIQISLDFLDNSICNLAQWQRRPGSAPVRGTTVRIRRDEIPHYVSRLIEQAESGWAYFLRESLTLEFILPFGLLDLPVEWWPKVEFQGSQVPLCADHPIVVRSLERHQNADWQRRWQYRWRQLKERPHASRVHWSSPQANDASLLRLERELSEDPTVACLVLSEPPSDPSGIGSRELLAGMRSGVPAIIWDRRGPREPAFEEAVRNLIRRNGLDNMVRWVAKLRLEALDSDRLDSSVGRHLAMLLDDPEHVPDQRTAPSTQPARITSHPSLPGPDITVGLDVMADDRIRAQMYGPALALPSEAIHRVRLTARAAAVHAASARLRRLWEEVVAAAPSLQTLPPEESREALDELALAGQELLFKVLLGGQDPDITNFRERLAETLSSHEGLRVRFDSELSIPWPMLCLRQQDIPQSASDSGSAAVYRRFLAHRHQIEQTAGLTPRFNIPNEPPDVPSVSLNHDLQLDRQGRTRASEVAALLTSDTRCVVRTTGAELLHALDDRELSEHLMYFWCHGNFVSDGPGPPSPVLRLTDSLPIDAHTIRQRRRPFEGDGSFQPFVVLNASYTGEPSADTDLVSFVEAFLRAGAKGVLVPQIEVPQAFAAEYALQFLTRYMSGDQTAGKAVHTAAQNFADNLHNPLGFAYALYWGMDARMERAAT
ncbi:SAV_2336 N-terminal domain-related protein [Streptomyces phaeochromogenes]|uniref:SAV_2336 N-terminal domain-related protein n=1 Tax=Streptomyces phaeochromogenes TaxID=1923 RepID=UPI003401F0D8